MTKHDADLFYWSSAWRRKRDEILRRDHYECVMCHKRIDKARQDGTVLTGRDAKIRRAVCVHHIKELKDCPELALDDDNLISLCHACHDEIHGRDAKQFKKFRYSKKKSISDERW